MSCWPKLCRLSIVYMYMRRTVSHKKFNIIHLPLDIILWFIVLLYEIVKQRIQYETIIVILPQWVSIWKMFYFYMLYWYNTKLHFCCCKDVFNEGRIDYSSFIRTTDPCHRLAVHKFWVWWDRYLVLVHMRQILKSVISNCLSA